MKYNNEMKEIQNLEKIKFSTIFILQEKIRKRLKKHST